MKSIISFAFIIALLGCSLPSMAQCCQCNHCQKPDRWKGSWQQQDRGNQQWYYDQGPPRYYDQSSPRENRQYDYPQARRAGTETRGYYGAEQPYSAWEYNNGWGYRTTGQRIVNTARDVGEVVNTASQLVQLYRQVRNR